MQQRSEIIKKENELEQNQVLIESRAAYALNLYSKISNITWDLAAMDQQKSERLVGCHSNELKKTFEKFELDIDQPSMSRFDIANTLWDMIEEGVDISDLDF